MTQRIHVQHVKQPARYDLPASIARELGRFLVTWAHFEQYIQASIWSQLQLSAAEGRIAVREPRVTDRLDMLRDVAQLNNTEADYVLLLSIRQRAAPLATMRHILAHSLWTKTGNDWIVLITRGQWDKAYADIPNVPTGLKAVQAEGFDITAPMLRQWASETHQLIEDFKTLGDKSTVVPPPSSPRKPKQQSARPSQTPDPKETGQ